MVGDDFDELEAVHDSMRGSSSDETRRGKTPKYRRGMAKWRAKKREEAERPLARQFVSLRHRKPAPVTLPKVKC